TEAPILRAANILGMSNYGASLWMPTYAEVRNGSTAGSASAATRRRMRRITIEYTAIGPAVYLVSQLFRKKTESSILSTPHAVFHSVNSLGNILLFALTALARLVHAVAALAETLEATLTEWRPAARKESAQERPPAGTPG